MSTIVRTLSLQQSQQLPASTSVLFTPAQGLHVVRAATLQHAGSSGLLGGSRRASSPTTSLVQRQSSPGDRSGVQRQISPGVQGDSGVQVILQTRAPPPPSIVTASASSLGPVRASSGGAAPMSPSHGALAIQLQSAPQWQRHSPTAQAANQSDLAELLDVRGGLRCGQADCTTCLETRRRGYVLCRLACGHIVRAQIVELNPDLPGASRRSESPLVFTVDGSGQEKSPQRERDSAGTSPPPRSILRQLSGARNLAQAPAQQETPGTMYRKATSSMTKLETTALSTAGAKGESLSSRGSGGGGAVCASLSLNSRGSSGLGGEKSGAYARGSGSSYSGSASADPTQFRRSQYALAGTTEAEVVTDSRGDVLHKMCNVILLSHLSEREQQLKVRGQIVATYWDDQSQGPSLDNSGEIQVLVTYVDPTERSVPLLFKTQYATNFGETETTEGNVIKWKASLCKVGKKFA